MCRAQGRRPTDQDRCVAHVNVDDGFAYMGVFDGHGDGGDFVAQYCSENLEGLITDELDAIKASKSVLKAVLEDNDELKRVEGAWIKAYERCHEGVVSDARSESSGSTALTAMVTDKGVMWFANTGDSRMVLCRINQVPSNSASSPSKAPGKNNKSPMQMEINVRTNATTNVFKATATTLASTKADVSNVGISIQMTNDHDAERPSEVERIKAQGGYVIKMPMDVARVGGVLAMTRAIGDAYLSPHVIPTPEVLRYDVDKQDYFAILATDGIWNFISNHEACMLVHDTFERVKIKQGDPIPLQRTCSIAAQVLVRAVLEHRGGNDNMGVVVIRFQ